MTSIPKGIIERAKSKELARGIKAMLNEEAPGGAAAQDIYNLFQASEEGKLRAQPRPGKDSPREIVSCGIRAVSEPNKDQTVQEKDVEHNLEQANDKVACKKDPEALELIEICVVNKDGDHKDLVTSDDNQGKSFVSLDLMSDFNSSMTVLPHFSSVTSVDNVSGANDMITTAEETSTTPMVIYEHKMNLGAYDAMLSTHEGVFIALDNRHTI
ncbi:unnamed protein product [Cochlearia groenlandica]